VTLRQISALKADCEGGEDTNILAKDATLTKIALNVTNCRISNVIRKAYRLQMFDG